MRSTSFRRIVPLSLTCLLCVVDTAVADDAGTTDRDWPQYRGPERTGVSAETGLADAWPKGGPPELWRRPVGAAFSGIVVVGDALYSCDSDAEHEYVFRLDAATGEERWRTALGDGFTNSFGDGPRSTPTVDGDQLFAVSAQAVLAALDTASGEVRWSIDLAERFGTEQPRFGFAASPLVVGELVIVEAGGADGHSMVAVDKADGEVRWSAGSATGAYGSPIHIEALGAEQIVSLNADDVVSVSPAGEVLWSHPFSPDNGVKPAMPIFVAPDLIFVSASYDIGALAVRMKRDGDAIVAEEVWQSRVMRNHFNSSVLVDGHVYGFDNATLKCVDPASGEQCWAQRRGLGKGSLIYADGDLVVLTERGRLMLVEATPEAFVEKASHQVLSDRCWTSPTLADGRVYLRNRQEMVALDLRAASMPTAGSAAAAEPAAEEGASR